MRVDEERHVEHDVVDRNGRPDFDMSDVDIVDMFAVRADLGNIVLQFGGEDLALIAELSDKIAVSGLDIGKGVIHADIIEVDVRMRRS